MRRPLFVVFVLAAFAAACQLIVGIDRVAKEDPVPDAAMLPDTTPPPVTPVVPDPCVHSLPPPAPTVDDDPNGDIGDAASGNTAGELFFALRTVNLTNPPGTQPYGYDLDGVCTCDKRKNTAFAGGESCARPAGADVPCDADGGVDNSLIAAITSVTALYDVDKAANINGRIAAGQRNALLVITKYNGRANDKEIGVGLFTSEGILDDHDPEAGVAVPLQPGCADSGLPVGGTFSPGWCGTDRWSVSTDSVMSGDGTFQPLLVGVGYVNNFTFVAQFDGIARLPFGGFHIDIGSPTGSGRIVPLDANQNPLDPAHLPDAGVPFWRVESGLLTGRAVPATLLSAVGTFSVKGTFDGGTAHVCSSSEGLLTLLKDKICPALDVAASARLDNNVPPASCSAISIAMSYRADPAVLDRFVVPPSSTNECFPSEADPTKPQGVPGVTYTCP